MRLHVLVALLTLIVVLGQPASGAEPPPKPATDLYGDPLPPGAVARFGTLRWRHNITVNSVAVSPDGSLIASGGNSGGVYVWDAKTGLEVERFRGKPIRGESVTFSPDGKLLLTGDRKRGVEEWEVSSGNLLHNGAGKYSECPLFAAEREDNKALVLCRSGKTILVDAKIVDRLVQFRKQEKGYGIDLSPDGKLAALAIDHGPVGLYDARTGEVLRKLQVQERGAFGVMFSPDSKRLAAWSGFGDLRVWDVSNGKELLRLSEDDDIYTFSPDGKAIVIYREGAIALVDVDTGKTVRRLEGSNRMVRELVYSADGRLLVAAGGDHTVRLWDSETGKEALAFAGQPFIVRGLAFSPDGKSLATCSEYGGAIVWDVATGRPRHQWSDFLYGVNAVAWSPDGAVLAAGESGGHDNREVVIRLLDPQRGRLVREFPAHLNCIFTLSFSPDGKQLASVGWDARARIWDPATGQRLHQIRGGDYLNDARFSRDGKTLVVDNGELEIYQTAGWRLLHRLEPEKGKQREVQRVGILPDGKTVITREKWEQKGDDGRFDGTYQCALCYRSVENGRLLRSVPLPESDQSWSGCLLSPDGDLFFETHQNRNDSDFRVRDAATGKVMGAYSGHTGTVSAWAFSPDGRRLATGSADTTVLLWDVTEMRIQYWWLSRRMDGG
jgi:WD40 repeat protein